MEKKKPGCVPKGGGASGGVPALDPSQADSYQSKRVMEIRKANTGRGYTRSVCRQMYFRRILATYLQLLS